ncbi:MULTISPECIES: hypothetical protein [unclassified Arcicella]|uniref:hypothetical protein n=1 Tax=unclassified Arcicella TaxID=2644986 RepID=UPI00285CD975|nr:MULTISPECIES: hypothetical protein [unclassified Arcicella]MDR6562733.1 hypothetical protein [Arcicella sp. BE51]MDR6812922.1 hypothetical protein [Arcicella sp. BE140]MDR6824236.1 hypothetical protein [Arcicella sp. BE139]
MKVFPNNDTDTKPKKDDNTSVDIKLLNGFSIKVLATDLGATRYIAVAKNGSIMPNFLNENMGRECMVL